MAKLTQPLRDEHKELIPCIEGLRATADSIGIVPARSVQWSVDEIYRFLTRQLLPHAQAEERVLYPAISELMGVAGATATMSRDHAEIGRLAEELGAVRMQLLSTAVGAFQEHALRRILYGLYAIVKLHIAKEEEIYLPLLDERLAPEDAQKLFEEMEGAAAEAKCAALG